MVKLIASVAPMKQQTNLRTMVSEKMKAHLKRFDGLDGRLQLALLLRLLGHEFDARDAE